MPGSPIIARTLHRAIVAAHRQGKTSARITLMNGAAFSFTIRDVGDDMLIGSRAETPGTAALIPYHAIAMIEFG